MNYGYPNRGNSVGFEEVTVEQYPSPQPLSMPIGWLTQSLTVEPLGKINAKSKYAIEFIKQEQR
ncbi:hypothetical protein [Vibrio sp. EJY3]|uniref:hypothetical protein n=1 Tax=Vibrio sp. (strain EJY3) TaxID=1116375 RepID=UPI000243BF4F|nr:hypothetical protein [Vibrio sp. EJY3]AEX24580.1 N-acetyltransferase GCN5 [Vibrio sp. EJY3]